MKTFVLLFYVSLVEMSPLPGKQWNPVNRKVNIWVDSGD